jgi:Zn-dependent protease with chaperone function
MSIKWDSICMWFFRLVRWLVALFLIFPVGLYFGERLRVRQLPDPSTARQQFILYNARMLAMKIGLKRTPDIVIGGYTHSVNAVFATAFIAFEPPVFDPKQFTDREVLFMLGHELGHIRRRDGMKMPWDGDLKEWSFDREYRADAAGVALVGCDSMLEAVTRHYSNFAQGSHDARDPHPTPEDRLKRACPGYVIPSIANRAD